MAGVFRHAVIRAVAVVVDVSCHHLDKRVGDGINGGFVNIGFQFRTEVIGKHVELRQDSLGVVAEFHFRTAGKFTVSAQHLKAD